MNRRCDKLNNKFNNNATSNKFNNNATSNKFNNDAIVKIIASEVNKVFNEIFNEKSRFAFTFLFVLTSFRNDY